MSRHEFLQTHEYGDLIRFDGVRLQNITIEHTHGEKKIDRGWDSVFQKSGKYDPLVEEYMDSSKTPFESLILLVPPKMLGTHEDTIGDPNNPKWIPSGREESGFAEIDFSKGWNGSPIAVAAFCECEGNVIMTGNIYDEIASNLISRGAIGLLDTLDYGDLGVLDGHHRAKMAAESVVQGLKYVPVQLIPYLYDKSVVLDTWHYDKNVWTGKDVFECFKVPGKFADAKRTKFGVKGIDGVIRRILSTQPNVKIPLENLR